MRLSQYTKKIARQTVLNIGQQAITLIFLTMEFVREITFTPEEKSLSRLEQLAGEYNAVFRYVRRIITEYVSTWPEPYREGMQPATIYLSFLCKDGKVVPIPVRMDVRASRIDVGSFATRKLNDLLKRYHWDWEQKTAHTGKAKNTST